ncbi:MAG: carbohydrate ABC transporter permease [Chloroflexi bacterium]|nr:carbohydrate ABC transporter permease [Chloroflexota bacterium]
MVTPSQAQPLVAPATRLHGARSRRVFAGVGVYAVALLFAFLFTVPFIWAVSTSLKEGSQIYRFPPEFIPNPVRLDNYPAAWVVVPFTTYLVNTLIVVFLAMVGQILSATLVAYGFARFQFPGRNVLFTLLLSTLMIPGHVLLIPQFILFQRLGWINTFAPLIVPYYFGGGAFYIFLLRQFFLTLPRDLDEAAEIDGAGTFHILTRIIVPLSRPVLATIAIFSFIYHWDDFIHPIIYLQREDRFTLAVGLRFLQGFVIAGMSQEDKIPLLMAASILVTAPIIVLFLTMQRYFVQGIVLSGLKG